MREFNSFGAFAAHLERLAVMGHEVTHHMADKAAEEVEKTARGMIGDYQQAVGPYPEWEELADRTKQERARLGYSENDPGYRSGEMKKSIGRKVEGNDAAVGSDDQHLVYFDQGTSKQPPRPVLGPAAIHSKPRVHKILGHTLMAWLIGTGWKRPKSISFEVEK